MRSIVRPLVAVLGIGLVAGCGSRNRSAASHSGADTHDQPTTRAGTDPTSHDLAMADVVGSPKQLVKTVGILVYDGVNDLDVIGPKYVLAQLMGTTTRLIAVQPGTIRTVMGTEIVPNAVIDSVDQLDILVIPGGLTGTIKAAYDERILDWIRRIDRGSLYTTSVCTGSWILGATGLLAGRRATTNWYRADEKMAKYGAVFSGERFSRDGKYWTSAGVTAGMDMALAIVRDIWGDAYTQAVMLDLEYDPAPPVAGGSPERTEPKVFRMMQAMYDLGAVPLIDSLETRRRKGNP
jgi:transcriptional regulator GlxA family with amidase domain